MRTKKVTTMEEVKFRPVLLRPARFARLIDYSRSKIYDMINRGELRAVIISGNLRIPATELERLPSQATTEQID